MTAVRLFFAFVLLSASAAVGETRAAESVTIPVFRNVPLQFRSDSTTARGPHEPSGEVNGRVVRATVSLPAPRRPQRITAVLSIRPEPESDREVYDRYDRAGNVRLVLDGGPDVEIVRFMTAYGGRTDYEVDVSHLAPLLRGKQVFRAFIDTWVSPAWRLDLSFRYTPADSFPAPSWAAPVLYMEQFNREENDGGASATVTIPDGMRRVVLKYLATGHCTDGRDEDEFVSKPNVIAVDGVVGARFHPWRDDCRSFRELNPYCARWTDGTWSSDYARSGWCPSQVVDPVEFDLSDHLKPGVHTIRFTVEEMRPRGADGHFGYWRLSAALVGWKEQPALWKNP
jgi:hypothetical protein